MEYDHAALAALPGPYVAASTDTSTITLDALQYGPRPFSLYLLAESSDTLARMFQVYRVVLDVIFAVLMRHKPYTAVHRLLFNANELPSYGYMQVINKNASVMRKYGIKGLFVAQDLKQLEDVYGQEPELWSNTDCKIFHAILKTSPSPTCIAIAWPILPP